jgi:3-deoxy-D-manno-octulosonate 8-phosphate phosphatase (KDO 8-P phosphatase)
MARTIRGTGGREALLERFRKVRLLCLDVDGTLTDGGIYYMDDGQQVRKFNSKDGMGLKQVMKAGIEVCWLTASNTASIVHRAKALGVPHILMGADDKLAGLKDLLVELNITLAEVAHMGDDSNDLPVLEAVGLALAPADAVLEVQKAAAHITTKVGGDGAVREICDLLVESRRLP